jgi:hypothetical protein
MADEETTYDVMVADPGGKTVNTIVVGGTDVVVPLERDLDGDPFHDDEVWLRSASGGVERRLLATDPDVERDDANGLLLYRFREVPFGYYGVWVNVGGEPLEVIRGLVVRQEGVFQGERKLKASRSGKVAPGPEQEETAPAPAPAASEPAPYVDQVYEEDL